MVLWLNHTLQNMPLKIMFITRNSVKFSKFYQLLSIPYSILLLLTYHHLSRLTSFPVNCPTTWKHSQWLKHGSIVCKIQLGCYNERMLQQTVFINKIRMLQRMWRNTIGQLSTRVLMTCWVFPLWLEHQSSSLLSFLRFSYQFSSVIYLFAPLAGKIFF
jgi:hypothetical protein